MRYQIVSDDDGHDYVIPCARVGRWLVWVSSAQAELGAEPPEWAKPINGPISSVTFTEFEIK